MKKKRKKDTQPIVVCHWKNFQKSVQIWNNSIFTSKMRRKKRKQNNDKRLNEWMNVCKSTWCLCLWAKIIILDSFVFPYADLVPLFAALSDHFSISIFSFQHSQFSPVVRVFPAHPKFGCLFFSSNMMCLLLFTVHSVQDLVGTIADCRFRHHHYSYHYYHCNKRSENGKTNSTNLFWHYIYIWILTYICIANGIITVHHPIHKAANRQNDFDYRNFLLDILMMKTNDISRILSCRWAQLLPNIVSFQCRMLNRMVTENKTQNHTFETIDCTIDCIILDSNKGTPFEYVSRTYVAALRDVALFSLCLRFIQSVYENRLRFFFFCFLMTSFKQFLQSIHHVDHNKQISFDIRANYFFCNGCIWLFQTVLFPMFLWFHFVFTHLIFCHR